MQHLLRASLLCLHIILLPLISHASPYDVEFGHVGIRDGLSNSQINTIFKDSRGYVWIGTQSGLCRYDGYRFKNYFYKSADKNSLPNNWISDIQEATGHRLLIRTPMGYTIFDTVHDVFNNDANTWMSHRHIKGNMDLTYIDAKKNWAVVANGIGLYYAKRNNDTDLYAFGKELPKGTISSITELGQKLLLTYDNGLLVCLNPITHRIVWTSSYIPHHRSDKSQKGYKTYISRFENLWVVGDRQTWIYNQKLKRWFNDLTNYLQAQDYSPIPEGKILIKDLVEDKLGKLWIGTEHRGLIRINYSDKSVCQFNYNATDQLSLSDNTIESLYLDPDGDLWVGTYKNGLSYYSPNASRFATIPVGDVCTIVEDNEGRYWCGTNDNGIIVYDPTTNTTHHLGTTETGIDSDVIVSSTRLKDGSLWFGAFNGGLACYHKGQWKHFRANDGSGLANDNVWSLCPLPDGRLVIGTLGGGVQIYNPATQKFETYNYANSRLASDYVNSVSITTDGKILAAHSLYYSIIDPHTRRVSNFDPSIARGSISSPAINQAIMDSRGIIWLASASGGCAYAPHTRQLVGLDWMEGVLGAVACSVAEDEQGLVWLISDHGASRIQTRKGEEGWEYYTEAFNEYDGLQKRQFNFRSILVARNGDIILGGQDGINIIPIKNLKANDAHDHVLFSGLRLFDHEMGVGEAYNGHVVLTSSLNESRQLSLNHNENAFTILLATNNVDVPATARFYYRLKGFSDKWLMTGQGTPEVTFTNLSPGKYTLEVRAMTRSGAISDAVSTLEIQVNPPFYRTRLAYFVYILLAIGLFFLTRRIILTRQLQQLRMERMRNEAEHNRQIDELKLNFFTNVSHELRTPLTLIVSPLATMMNNERDPKKRERLSLIHRNAERLFELVNQLLDFRKMDQKKQVLEPITGNIVAFVHDIVRSYHLFSDREVSLEFHSDLERLSMSFDPDKLRKVLDNLLSNAFKYTHKGGQISISLSVVPKALQDEDALYIRIADNGEGIPDEDKPHIFEPFFQASNHTSTPYGGSGVGLSLVKDFVKMHDGTIIVEDNPGGGSLFTVAIPIRHDATLSHLAVEEPTVADEEETANEKADKQKSAKPKGRRSEVLLVDDAEDFLTFMSEVLSERYMVRTAHDGVEALERLEEHLPNIILSDVMMPRMDGRELCRKLKSDERTAAIPFIMLTARIADTHMVEGMKLGADDYLTKPFNMDLLFLRIENLLKWHHATTDKTPMIKPEIKEPEITTIDQQFVQAATCYVEKHLSDCEISVETMAADMNVSRVQLYRRLLSLTGSTPSEFIRTIRLRHAKLLLSDKQISVSEVAYRVGFSNPRSFSKYFTEMYGITPSQYCKDSEAE